MRIVFGWSLVFFTTRLLMLRMMSVTSSTTPGMVRDLVLHALDLDAGDGAAFEAGEQDAAQAVADGDAEAALERLGEELAVGVGQGRRGRRGPGWAVPGRAIEFAWEILRAVGFPPASSRDRESTAKPDGDS